MNDINNSYQTYKTLRATLVSNVLHWEYTYGVAPSITSAISEIDAAELVGLQIDKHSENQLAASKIIGFELQPTYADLMQGKSAVRKGYDFEFNGLRFQVKANRPSGKPGSYVTLAPKPKNLDWDYLIYMLYNRDYELEEAWLWKQEDFIKILNAKKRISPKDYREGLKINIEIPNTIGFEMGVNPHVSNYIKIKKNFSNGMMDSDLLIDSMEKNLHGAINYSVGELIRKNKIELPRIKSLFQREEKTLFFKVLGMYGGFIIWLDYTQPKLVLYAYGFCRIHEGSERLFKIDEESFRLLRIGRRLCFE